MDEQNEDAGSTTDQLVNSGHYNPLAVVQYKSESKTLDECRRLFKGEVVKLKAEVDGFRINCESMIEQDRRRVEEHKQSCDQDLQRLLREYEHKRQAITTKLDLQNSLTTSDFLERKQQCLDAEQELINREDSLVKEQQRLEEYERELEEIERNLNRREKMYDAQNKNLMALQEELNALRQESEMSKSKVVAGGGDATRDQLVVYTPSTTYSNIVERDLRDRCKTMELTLAEYRSELANAKAQLTIKDITINKLQTEISQQTDNLDKQTDRVKQLESRLMLLLSERKPDPIDKKTLCRQSSVGGKKPQEKSLKRRHTVNNLLSNIRGRRKSAEIVLSAEPTPPPRSRGFRRPSVSPTEPSATHEYNSLPNDERTSVCAIM